MLSRQHVEVADDLQFVIIEDLEIVAGQRSDRVVLGIADHHTHQNQVGPHLESRRGFVRGHFGLVGVRRGGSWLGFVSGLPGSRRRCCGCPRCACCSGIRMTCRRRGILPEDDGRPRTENGEHKPEAAGQKPVSKTWTRGTRRHRCAMSKTRPPAMLEVSVRRWEVSTEVSGGTGHRPVPLA